MSIIEQAARRLDELKRAGVDVPWSAPGLAPSDAVAAQNLRAIDGGRAVDTSGRRTDSADAARRSRTVEIDLARLEREGYLVPHMAHSALATELRIIKQHFLRHAREAQEGGAVRRGNLILVTSAVPGEGKTFVAMNLAMSIALEVDHSVLLVDADVLRPAVFERYGLPAERGLLDLLVDPKMRVSDVLLRTNVPKLSLLPAGTPNPHAAELLASENMDQLLDELASRYSDRVVVFDAPPLLPTAESRVLASRAGQVLMVVGAETTPQSVLERAYSAVESCPNVTSVLNRARAPGNTSGYGYGTYGSY
jgi:protein-tyrosine kinase